MTQQVALEQDALSGGYEEQNEPVHKWATAAPLTSRLSAFAIDSAILAAVGAALGYFLHDVFVPLGNSGKLVGFVIAFLYFVPSDCKHEKGRTPGKRLMHIRVVDETGGGISLARSAARFMIAAMPVFLIGLKLTYGKYNWIAVFLTMFLSVGLGGGLVYLLAFNRRTGQSVHDLVCGTYVITDITGSGRFIGHHVALAHYIVISVYLVLISVFVLWNTPRMISAELFKHVAAVKGPLSSLDGVIGSSVKWGSYMQGEGSYMDVTVFLGKEPPSYKQAVDDAAMAVLKSYPHIGSVEDLAVTATYGYDIGIFWSYQSSSITNTPGAWKRRLGLEDAG